MIKIKEFLRNRVVILAAIFLFVFITHSLSFNITSFDSKWSIFVAQSIIREGDIDLDEYPEALAREKNYAIEEVNGHKYSIFPIGVSVLAVPFVFVADEYMKIFSQSHQVSSVDFYPTMEKWIASFVIALAAVFIYLISEEVINLGGSIFDRIRKKSWLYSLVIVFIFAFCTSAWSTGSRGLWMHGPTMLMLAISLYLILRAKEKPHLVQFVSLPLAFSYAIRPTSLVFIIPLTIYVFISYRQYFLKFILWSLVVILPFLAFNYSTYQSLLSPYYATNRIRLFHDEFFEALAGNLISPGRGLFVFSPILLFCFWGIWLKIKNKSWQFLDWVLVSVIILHWVAVSSFLTWDGGHCYGPRYMSDVIPIFIYFLIPALAIIPQMSGMAKIIYLSIFILLGLISFLIHFRGANDWDVYVWNSVQLNKKSKVERVWDIHDLQFMRGLTDLCTIRERFFNQKCVK